MKVERHFLNWDEPVVNKVRDFLLPSSYSDPIDLTGELVVVPTRQSGRRLRESLALRCSKRDTAFFPPRIVAPTYFLYPGHEANPASRIEIDAAWISSLIQINPKEFKSLFPAPIHQNDFTWAMQISESIQNLRDTLADGGYSIRDVCTSFGDTFEEKERWNNLAALEKLYLECLLRIGVEDPCQLMINQTKQPDIPSGIKRIVIAAVPDPTPLMVRAIGNLAITLPVEVLIHAPESLKEHFDQWGRPIADHWRGIEIDIPDQDHNLVLSGSPSTQSRKVLDVISGEADRYGPTDVAIGVPDTEVTPFMSADLEERGLIPFDPSGKPVRTHPLFQLLDACRVLVNEESYPALSSFLRNADILNYLQKAHSISPAHLLAELDTFQNRHLPMSVNDTGFHLARESAEKEFGNLRTAFDLIVELIEKFRANDCVGALRHLLQHVYQVKILDPRDSTDGEFASVAEIINEAFRDLDRESVKALQHENRTLLEILIRSLGRLLYYPEPANAVVDLEGWLELAFNDAPMLIVTGMNDNFVPNSQLSDIFLPDSLRKKLGLQHDSQGFAVDAFIMSSLIESRRKNGRTCFIAGKTNAAGDPLKPSRLLFRCNDANLPERARQLFAELAEEQAAYPSTISFKLSPYPAENRPPVNRLAVTAFKDYLACPFRFYLKHVLKMEHLDDLKTEMDFLDFGMLIHDSLHQMARDERMRRCEDEHRLRQFLHSQTDKWINQRFGESYSLPVQIQLDAAKQRLAAAARVQVRLISEGWETVYSEFAVNTEINCMTVSGRIDRIDRHRKTGAIRILDYKTTDRFLIPEEAHIGPSSLEVRDYARVFTRDKEKRWIDLQLPLYEMLLPDTEEFKGEIQLGYFNLPKAVSETDLSLWNHFTENRYDSARDCIKGIIEDISNSRFWPPVSKIKYDDFEELFQAEVTNCVDFGIDSTI